MLKFTVHHSLHETLVFFVRTKRYFCGEISNKQVMDTKKNEVQARYERHTDVTAKMITMLGGANLRTMRGKMLLNAEESELVFQENTPRGARSVEVGRTMHSRIVRRPDGLYTLTFRFDAGMRYAAATLVSELRDACKAAEFDMKKQKGGKR